MAKHRHVWEAKTNKPIVLGDPSAGVGLVITIQCERCGYQATPPEKEVIVNQFFGMVTNALKEGATNG